MALDLDMRVDSATDYDDLRGYYGEALVTENV